MIGQLGQVYMRTCDGKKEYLTWLHAVKDAKAMDRKRPRKHYYMMAYRCDIGHIHVGSEMKAAKRKSLRKCS